MRLSYTTTQRLGLAALLALVLTVVLSAVVTMSRAVTAVRTDLISAQLRKDRYADISHSFAAASERFFAAMALGDEDTEATRSILDDIRATLADLRVTADTSAERLAITHLIDHERRLRTSVYAYESADLGDPARDFDQRVARRIRAAAAESIVEAERHRLLAAADADRAADRITNSLARTKELLIVGGGGIVLLALLASILLGRALTRHIKNVLDATESLAQGRFDVHPHAPGSDIVWRLCQGIARMGEQIQARTQALLAETKRANEARRAAEMANAKAEAANRAKGEFLANMSHEIRTPMTAVLGFAESMLSPDFSPSEKLNAIYTIRRNGEHLLHIINDILDISKIEAGKLDVERIRCSPVQLVADAKSLLQVRADAKNVSFKTEYVGAIPETIESDPIRLKQILVNLIGNAIKFTQVGSVELITRLIGDDPAPKLQFEVTDTGIGMTAEQVSMLFQPFAQADASTTRKFGGTGLGLLISRRLAEMLGGTVTVDSKVGQGSRFCITVSAGSLQGVKMLDDPAAATIARPTTGAATDEDDAGLEGRILLAEDGLDNQRLIAHVLKRAGAQVTVTENGKLAVEAIGSAAEEGEPFDVILMDMQMPVMDGYEATSLLRQRGYRGPIIALTAHAMPGDREKCLAAGCDDYATKPVDRPKLLATIRQWQQKSHASEKRHASVTGDA